MNTKIITIIVMGVSVAGLVVWDLVVNFNKVAGDTISEILGGVFKSAPILGVVLGVVVGHLGSNHPAVRPLVTYIGERPIIAIVAGIPIGFLFWNMER